ncbi:lysosomal acid glucosylceramidase [Strongylocentrotus purpuratus]|uniref:Glucosylceramidase n=1 Tax=Strongylocentrotus purpuratus TaxID=7668 RepID=A0A7M7N7P3_STRPU|nr:lysosomal acid glucosylceramidase [Strongylocentrotus purpuratus]|eukprot:XP_011672820.1 PREDICTED: glucosylceramidase isoform X2 [Strongylocentrotus purpuratus]
MGRKSQGGVTQPSVNIQMCLLVAVVIFSLVSTSSQSKNDGEGYFPCNKTQFASGDSFVCQCNSTYCDTIEGYLPLLADHFTYYTSSKASDRFAKRIAPISAKSNASASTVNLTINTSDLYQKVLGFGGAVTDSMALSVKNLSAATQNHLIRSYYSADGLEYTFSRINIGTCDFSKRPYSLCESENDFALTNFSLADEDINYKIPVLHAAMEASVRPLKFFCTQWSPPKWMKTSGTYRYRGQVIGEPGGKYYKTLALYLAKFIEGYAKHNVSMWGMTIQNEPWAGAIKDQPNACNYMTPQLERDFVKRDLGPTLEEHGLGHVNIMMLDDQRFELPDWPVVVLGDSEAEKYIKGIAVHWYWDKEAPTLKLDLTNNLFPDKFILYTEACEGTSATPGVKVDLGVWARGERFSQSIIENMSHWVTGWVDWNMALNIQGGPSWIAHKLNAPIIVDAEYDVFYKQPMFYHLGHFSKFVLPDSSRVGLKIDQSEDQKLEAISFLRPDGIVALVVINVQEDPIPISINHSTTGFLDAIVPARSIQTYLWKATHS